MNHSKVCDIKYQKIETQPYLTSNLFCDKETKLLTALRSRMHDSFKNNLSNMHGGHIDCALNCWSTDDQSCKDSQEHLLLCNTIMQRFHSTELSEDIQYCDIFGDNVKKQKLLAVLFARLLEIKEDIIKEREPADLDPCTSGSYNLCNGDAIFTPVSIVCSSGIE